MLPYEHPPAAPPPALLFKKRFFLFKKRYGPFYFTFLKTFVFSQSATSGIKTSKPISDKRDKNL